ncbi:PorV/PorQ family protein [candidate division KSB1 bacterium]|nr:PorV/PorQ family protein [candidate division KSB1 bacterium]
MKNIKLILLMLSIFILSSNALAGKKKVAQSGMGYLAISMGARESAMGDAGTAITKGIQGMWHNPSVIADIDRFAVSMQQVNWMVDTKLYGFAAAYSLGNWGTVAMDLTYMDYGEIMGTQRVDKSVDYRGFVLTGDVGVEDYAIGFAYARRMSDKFTLGFKVKRLHESLGNARYVYQRENEGTDEQIDYYKDKKWSMNDWGLDIGTVYDVGWKSLKVAMTMQNFSRDLKYWYEEFTTPMALRIGLAMDIAEVFLPNSENLNFNLAVDAIHPNDYTERVHIGGELLYLNRFALRCGYKFNHDVENFTFGLGVDFTMAGLSAVVDYAYTNADYFQDINRFSMQFYF